MLIGSRFPPTCCDKVPWLFETTFPWLRLIEQQIILFAFKWSNLMLLWAYLPMSRTLNKQIQGVCTSHDWLVNLWWWEPWGRQTSGLSRPVAVGFNIWMSAVVLDPLTDWTYLPTSGGWTLGIWRLDIYTDNPPWGASNLSNSRCR